MKKIVGCFFLVIMSTFFLFSKPPMLIWNNNSCWSSTALWLLYNIPELVEDLITNETKYTNKNNTIKYLIDLLKVMRSREEAGEETAYNKQEIKKLENELKDAQEKYFNNIACPLTGVTLGSNNDAKIFFIQLIKSIPQSDTFIFKPIDNIDYAYYKIDKPSFGFMKNDIKNYIYIDYEDFIDHKTFEQLPMKEIITIVEYSDSLDINNSNPTGVTYTYELIGMAVTVGTHVFAFIKDQREKNPRWYSCDDLMSIEKIDQLPLEWPNNQWKTGKPTIMIYKKIAVHIPDISPVIDEFALSLSSF